MTISPGDARAIAREAYIYGFPLVDNYRIQYSYFVDRDNPDFKGPWNQIHNIPRVYTPDDKTIQTPNSDTPYSMIGADLRAEPIVLTIPLIEPSRYFSVQFIDAYTFNFAYVGSRTTGNGGGNYLLAGPHWQGEKPQNMTRVIRAETEFVFVLYRTQLFNPNDIENVKKVQAGYKVQTLSKFRGQSASPPAPKINFRKPLTPEDEKTSVEFFNVLNFVLQFCPAHPAEMEMMERFHRLGIGDNHNFDVKSFSPEVRNAISDGMAEAWQEFEVFKTQEIDTGKRGSGDLVGTRDHVKGNYLYRMTAAVLGIYGNSKEEAVYPVYFVDSSGHMLDGSRHQYVLRFGPGQLPPVNAFWSLTMYELPSSLLCENSLNRYLINSAMLTSLKRDSDGGLTIYLQCESPGKDKESNWLPAPNGEFFTALRLYWPMAEVIRGQWKAPALQRRTPGELKKAS
jgi:hypothetical protein